MVSWGRELGWGWEGAYADVVQLHVGGCAMAVELGIGCWSC